jgi:GNAT superfamily N-acetyltransferase
VPKGKTAAVVTSLEMRDLPPPDREALARSDLFVRRVEAPTADWYLDLFREIGTEYLWFGRLRMSRGDLQALLDDPLVEIYTLHEAAAPDKPRGLLELDRRVGNDIELGYFGLTPEIIGRGAGRFLMAQAIEKVRAYAPDRFWVHTCTLDHPSALGFYRKSGFVPYERSVEIADDPRLDGTLPRDAAPRVPII